MEWPWRVKLRQAELHLRRFSEEVQQYVSQANVGFEWSADSDGTVSVRLRATHEPPMRLGAIAGDVLHNLRSALDAIAWEAVTRSGPPPDEKRVYFPVTITVGDWPNAAASKLPGLAPEAHEHFRGVQPWYWDEQARSVGVDIPLDRARRHPLWLLHRMAREDRHRTPQPIVARAGHTWLGLPEGMTATASQADPAPWRAGDTVIRWSVVPVERVAEVSPNGEALITFDNEMASEHTSAIRALEGMTTTTSQALRQIEIEVLEVVTRAELTQLSELRRLAEEADEALRTHFDSTKVITVETHADFKELQHAQQAATANYAERWRELFE